MKKNLLFILSIFILSISFVACSSKQSSNPFIGDWQGVRLDNQSGVYANETVVRNYKISIYQDGSFVVTESSSGSANYVYKYE